MDLRLPREFLRGPLDGETRELEREQRTHEERGAVYRRLWTREGYAMELELPAAEQGPDATND